MNEDSSLKAIKAFSFFKAIKVREEEKKKEVRERKAFFQVKPAVKKDRNVSKSTKEHS